jgi:hypothetical protein
MVKIQFCTDDVVAAEHFPPVPAKKLVPNWYKNLDVLHDAGLEMSAALMSQYNSKVPQTIKACVPVMDFLTSGYVLRAPADVVITPDNTGEFVGWSYTSSEAMCSAHAHAQCPVTIDNKKHNYIKVHNPWVVKTPAGYSSYFYQPDFFGSEGIKLFSGVVDTDTYTDSVMFPGYLKAEKSFVIHAGDPVMVVFPFKRDSWEHEVLVQPKKPSVIPRVFVDAYRKFIHHKKQYN